MNVRSISPNFTVTAAVLILLLPFSLKSLDSQPSEVDRPSLSPDKKWEYRPDESHPKIVKAGTDEVALDLSDQPAGNGFRFATVIWAPDSKRFAFNYGQGREHATSLYQLRSDEWVTLKAPGDVDEILKLADDAIKAQVKKAGVFKKMTNLRELQWTLEVRQWIDPNTAILYASLRERAERGSDLDREDLGYFDADFLFTLKFDEAGNWKTVKTHRMSGKAAESPSPLSVLADEVLYQSPKVDYRIQATADGTALWIVPTKDPSRRKPLPGADPDNREASEFSGSPDEKWLYDDREHELYRDSGGLSFSALNKKQWFWKNAVNYASKEFHFARRDVTASSAGWSSDSARLLVNFDADLQQRFAYFNTRTKAFEQTPYLRMVNTKLQSGKPFEAFPNAQFARGGSGRYMVFAEPIDAPPSEALLKTRYDALDQKMNGLREKNLADRATRDNDAILKVIHDSYQRWNKAREDTIRIYLPFAPKLEQENRRLQFLCDLTEGEVKQLEEFVAPAAGGSEAAERPAPTPTSTP